VEAKVHPIYAAPAEAGAQFPSQARRGKAAPSDGPLARRPRWSPRRGLACA